MRIWRLLRLGVALAALVGLGLFATAPAEAQKSGGTIRIYNSSNPPSASIHEEATIAAVMPFAAVFNNLVQYDPTKPRNGFDTIIPELAESWSLDATGTKLTFKLRQGVKWHDGQPMSAKDVQCTWHRLNGKEPDFYRRNPRKIWYENLREVTLNGDHEATFHMTRPMPSFLAMLASGFSPVYPCHIAAKDMRIAPVGTGPFKFVEFRSNDSIRVVRNPDYWQKGLPLLDAIEWRIVPNRSTRVLAFVAGEFDMTFVADITVPLMRDIGQQAPKSSCSMVPTNVPINIIINSERKPFDQVEIRRAVGLAIDRKAFIDILAEGQADVAAWMLAPPIGAWGMPPEEIAKLPGYGADVAGQQAAARRIMEGLGYSASNRLKVKLSTRDFTSYRDPAVILVDQLNKIHFDAELEVIESSVWFNRLGRKDYAIGLNLSGVGIDDPDVTLGGGFACKSEVNRTNYCNPAVEKLLEAQSVEPDIGKRKQLVWQIERILAEDGARPVVYHSRAATCWHPHVKSYVHHENSLYNNWRFERVWLDK